MESFGEFSDGGWESLSKIFSSEELEFTPQILQQFSFPLDQDQDLSFFTTSSFPSPDSEPNESFNGVLFSDFPNMNAQESCSPSSNSSGSSSMPPPNNDALYLQPNSIYMNFDGVSEKNVTATFLQGFSDISMDGIHVNEKLSSGQPAANAVLTAELQLKRKHDAPELHPGEKMERKKPRTSRNAQKVCKNSDSKKKEKENPNGTSNIDGESKTGSDGQSSSSYSSEEENGSQETNGGPATSDSKTCQALNVNGKIRASRGAATDPQSLYARKRRERINERLRILQNLVPNGTKVDISTMLEEAVHYVKFLQLQIKLLSSDELWMYAPLAYNGVDIGLNQKLSALL